VVSVFRVLPFERAGRGVEGVEMPVGIADEDRVVDDDGRCLECADSFTLETPGRPRPFELECPDLLRIGKSLATGWAPVRALSCR
jgi:hypothetical protein